MSVYASFYQYNAISGEMLKYYERTDSKAAKLSGNLYFKIIVQTRQLQLNFDFAVLVEVPGNIVRLCLCAVN